MRRLAVFLAAGVLAVAVASAASLAVDGVTGKRIVGAVVAATVAVTAGVWVGMRNEESSDG